ncbi:MAG: DNA-directed RNA polymerase subunit F [Candidatus Aenigmatarchaeota archaeon]
MEVLEEKSITLSEAKEILEKKKDDKRYEIVNALEYLRKFSSLSSEDVEKLKKELANISKLSEEEIVKICDFLPKTKDEIRVILYKSYNKFEEKEIEKIIEIVKKFA